MLGPGEEECKSVSYLNRKIFWNKGEITYEHDPRHVQVLLEEYGMTEAKPLSTP